MGPDNIGDLVASSGDADDWLWKTVRKGVAPAFAPHALRYAKLYMACYLMCFVPFD